MLCDNCEKVVLKSIQRKYYKTVMNIEMGDEVKLVSKAKEEQQVPVKILKSADSNNNNNKTKEEQANEKKLMIFD